MPPGFHGTQTSLEIPRTPYPGGLEVELTKFAKRNLFIRTKRGGRLIPLEPNYTQRYVLRVIDYMRAIGLPPRINVLKSRQVGVSTLSQAIQFYNAYTHENRAGLVLAHNERGARGLFKMTRRFVDNFPAARSCPEGCQCRTRASGNPKHDDVCEVCGGETLLEPLKLRFDNTREVQLDKNNSRLNVEAEGDAGRSNSAQDVHVSEAAFMEEFDVTLDALLQTVPNDLDSLVVIESTANGVGNFHYESWKESIDNWSHNSTVPIQERGFFPIFIPWFRHAEYAMPAWFESKDLTAIERSLVQAFTLTIEQIAWRRWCIKNNCKNSEDTFRQEYPATWKEAFLLTGRPIFDREPLTWLDDQQLKRKDRPEPQEIEWESSPGRGLNILVPRLLNVSTGRFHVYEEPKARHTYIVGVDPSEGDAGSDYSPCAVLDQMTLNHVATWYGKEPPERLAEIAMRIGYYYNTVRPAQIIHEANNHGHTFGLECSRKNYPNMYYRPVSKETVSLKITDKLGWWSDEGSNHFRFDALRRFLHDKYREHREGLTANTRLIVCPYLISEMLTLIYVRSGDATRKTMGVGGRVGKTRVAAQPGKYKDLATGFSLCLVAAGADGVSTLEPLPEEFVLSEAGRISMIRERDVDGAERESLDVLGMTCEEMNAALDEMALRDAHRSRYSLEGML